MKKPVFKLLAVAALAMSAFGANAAVGDVTTNVINGTGITNGNFTIGNANGVEIGLRARVRFDGTNLPTNDNAQNGAGNTYSVPVGQPSPGFSFQPNSSSSAKWNFDWSINTGTASVGSYTYLLSMDFDPTFGINYQAFNPINGTTTCADHAFGNSATAQSGGAYVPSKNCSLANAATDYANLINGNSLVQNSWNYEFFDSLTYPFNANVDGNYTILLQAFSANGAEAARSQIEVIVGGGTVPEPGSLALVGLALGGLAIARKRKTAK